MKNKTLLLAFVATLTLCATIAPATLTITSLTPNVSGDTYVSSTSSSTIFGVSAWAGHEGDYLQGSFSGSGSLVYKVTYTGSTSLRPTNAIITDSVQYYVDAGVRMGAGTSNFHATCLGRIDYNPSSFLQASVDEYQSPYYPNLTADDQTLTESLVRSGTFSLVNGEWVAYVTFQVPTMYSNASSSSWTGSRGTSRAETSFTFVSLTSS